MKRDGNFQFYDFTVGSPGNYSSLTSRKRRVVRVVGVLSAKGRWLLGRDLLWKTFGDFVVGRGVQETLL